MKPLEMTEGFLPISGEEMRARGMQEVDFVYVCGDAYVDHPSFGNAIISRILESHGYRIGMLCQPDWRNPESVKEFGTPRLGFLVSAGNMDSMVNHYTVAKKRRKTDAYSPGGRSDARPDRAVIVYCNLIRRSYKNTPIIIGGIEASLRRFGHYDYWSDKVRRSILLESGADLISYGMGEKSIVEIADCLNSGIAIKDISFIDGTVYKTRNEADIYDAIRLPDFEEIIADRYAYAKSIGIQYENTDPFQAKRLYEAYDNAIFVVQNPPAKPLSEMEMDDVYALPYMRKVHPSYQGTIPALQEVEFSLTSNRGCFGGCNFCALTFHEGRIVQTRSHSSIVEEAKTFLENRNFKGYIHDVGGPTADFRRPACKKQRTLGACKHRQCLFPTPCPHLEVDHQNYIQLLRKLRKLDGIKKVFVRSGIRFDYLLADVDRTFLKELCMHHISGQLRVAPEHISDAVLSKMGKPSNEVYEKFEKAFYRTNETLGKEQYMVPYLMSSHPGSRLEDAIALAEYLKKKHLHPEQVQDFYPTPGTISTCMYYTGLDPQTMETVYVARDPHEKAMQRALIQFSRPENYTLVKEALEKAGRTELIGFGPECLIPPRPMNRGGNRSGNQGGNRSGKHRSAKRNQEARSKKGRSRKSI